MGNADGEMDDLAALRAECERLRAENAYLKSMLGPTESGPSPAKLAFPPMALTATAPDPPDSGALVTSSSPVAAKLAVFRTLFRGRNNVYAVRWQSKAGRSGYAPACAHEWDRALCAKPKVKCADCANRALLPLTDEAIRDHLTGRHTLGVYPLLPDDSCRFLALDFDKAEWQHDVSAFTGVCAKFDVPAYVEVSRSGNGAHMWVFFAEAIDAARARRLGWALLTRTTAQRHEVGLDSYDRQEAAGDRGGDGSDAGRGPTSDRRHRPLRG